MFKTKSNMIQLPHVQNDTTNCSTLVGVFTFNFQNKIKGVSVIRIISSIPTITICQREKRKLLWPCYILVRRKSNRDNTVASAIT